MMQEPVGIQSVRLWWLPSEIISEQEAEYYDFTGGGRAIYSSYVCKVLGIFLKKNTGVFFAHFIFRKYFVLGERLLFNEAEILIRLMSLFLLTMMHN